MVISCQANNVVIISLITGYLIFFTDEQKLDKSTPVIFINQDSMSTANYLAKVVSKK